LGNYSGRNAGDAALLEGLMRDVAVHCPDAVFIVPTLNPSFLRRAYPDLRVEPVGIAPWHGALKFWGRPLGRALRSADLVLVTDAILFDVRLFNPAHNYLLPLSFWLPRIRRRGVPVVLYNVSVGPVATAAGQRCLRRVLGAADLVILRDEESRKTIAAAGAAPPMQPGADCALSARPCPAGRAEEIIRSLFGSGRGRPLVGINLNAYGYSFLRRAGRRYSEEEFLSVMARLADWMRSELVARICLVGTQRMDVPILKRLRAKLAGPKDVPIVANDAYSHGEIMGVLSRLELFIAMRTHAAILATSVHTPVVGIVVYPKTYGYLARLGQEGNAILFSDVTFEKMRAAAASTWASRRELRRNLAGAVEREKKTARESADFLLRYLPGRASVAEPPGRRAAEPAGLSHGLL
jgi:polysaccharide pyruvyl transferase WcaK-like protein